ncbi:MAG: serine/threonine-protein kinase [Verrucomicrobiales bacterium]|nr:serine/threonine-protein kinase [Verrucomicrobiales bacterium]
MSDRYEIRGNLGRGGMSTVYRAFDTVMGREVALKRLLPLEDTNLNASAGDALASEAAALARFQHPNIVSVFAFEEDEEGPYVVMELVEGVDLHHVLKEGALSLDDFNDIALQCLEPLVSASEQGLLHRDIKPGNIMLTITPSDRFLVKILDFGLAKFSQQPSTQTLDQAGTFLGSIDYIAPEQLELELLDQRTDLYSVGCVLYYALAQKAPFSGDNPAKTSMNHLNHVVEPIHDLRPDLPVATADWLMRMISRYPDDRPADALEALKSFRLVNEGSSSGEAVDSVSGMTPPHLSPTLETYPSETELTRKGADAAATKRPALNLSPQMPRSRRERLQKARRANHKSKEEWFKHPLFVVCLGCGVVGLFILFLFKREPEAGVALSQLPVVQSQSPSREAEVKKDAPPARPLYVLPGDFELGGEPEELAVLPDSTNLLLRFASAEGVRNKQVEEVVDSGAVAIWTNLISRSRYRSLFPSLGDIYGEHLPILKTVVPGGMNGLKTTTPAVMLNNRCCLLSRAEDLNLSRGLTIIVVARLGSGTGRKIWIDPGNGDLQVAEIQMDLNGDIVGATKVGPGVREYAVKAAMGKGRAGVIAYGTSPVQGKHRLLTLPAGQTEVSGAEGEYAAESSPFRRIIIGKNEKQANPEGAYSSWIFEVLLYDKLLSSREMSEICSRLSAFYFEQP